MTKKASPVVVSEDEEAILDAEIQDHNSEESILAAEVQAINDERNAILQLENAEAALLRSQIRAENAGVELNDHGVPIGIDLTFEETMRMHRAMTALGTSAEHSVEEEPVAKRKRK